MILSEHGKQQIKKFCDEEDDSGWFHNGHETFFNLAEELMEHGYSEYDAIVFLFTAYATVANEYGD